MKYISTQQIYKFYVLFSSIVHPNHAITLLWLPPPEYSVGSFGCRRQLDGHHLGLQERTKVQLSEKLPLDTIVGRKLHNDTWNHRKKKPTRVDIK